MESQSSIDARPKIWEVMRPIIITNRQEEKTETVTIHDGRGDKVFIKKENKNVPKAYPKVGSKLTVKYWMDNKTFIAKENNPYGWPWYVKVDRRHVKPIIKDIQENLDDKFWRDFSIS